MPENENNQNTENQGAAEFKAPASQEELDRIIGSRLDRERQKFADYDDLKAKASKYDEAENAAKSELEREREARTKAEAERDNARNESLRARVAAEKGVPVDSIHGATEEALKASADNLLQWRKDAGEHFGSTARGGSSQSGASGSGADAGTDPKERAAAAMRRLGSGN